MKNKNKLSAFILVVFLMNFFVTSNSLALNSKATFDYLGNVYKLDGDHIDVTNVNVNLEEGNEPLSYSESMALLDKELTDTTLATGKTSVYVDESNTTDKENNIFKVDIDFAGRILTSPTNVVFLMDQSGSMNMSSADKYKSIYTSPCFNSDLYYRLRVLIDGKSYVYYHNAVESNITDGFDKTIKTSLPPIIKAQAIDAGIATNSSIVTIASTFRNNDAPENHIYQVSSNVSILTNEDRFYPYTYSHLLIQTDAEKEYFTKVDLGFLQVDSATDIDFYSPSDYYNTTVYAPSTPDYKTVGSDAYFDYLNNNSLCYDRMMVSKSLFYELSNQALVGNPDNTIGFANFAGKIYNTRNLNSTPFDATFTNTVGFDGTNWGIALDKADEILSGRSEGKNIVIFVTDGEPSVSPNTPATVKTKVDTLVANHDAIVYYVGIDLPDSTMNKYSEALTTDNSKGEPNAYNGSNLEELKAITEELEKILTATNNLTSEMGELFTLEIDNEHPIELTYTLSSDGKTYTDVIYSIAEASKYGITYDTNTNKINWDMDKVGITNARLSYYKQLDSSKVDFNELANGNILDSKTLNPTVVDYIDYKGTVNEFTMDNNSKVTLNGHSELTITNKTTTPYNVDVNDNINYDITIKNTGNVDASNLVVKQLVPNYTDFVTTTKGLYNKETNDITLNINELKANSELEFSYVATANTYNTYIHSSAQLGVQSEITTLDENGWPILSAVILEHKTPENSESTDVGSTKPNEDNTTSPFEDPTVENYEGDTFELPDTGLSLSNTNQIISVLVYSFIALLVAYILNKFNQLNFNK